MMIRKRNNGNTKWQTPLPTILSSPTLKKHKSRRSGDNKNVAMVICSSMLCILLVLVGSIMYWSSSTIIPTSIITSKVHVSNFITQQRRVIDHSTSIQYVNLQHQQDVWDVVVVGCGPAGLTSALFASRMGLSVLVLGSPSEGSLSGTNHIDNFPSFFDQANGGQSWIDITMNQAYTSGAQFASPTIMATGISQTTKVDDMLEVQLNTNTKVLTKSIVVASGSIPNKLNLPHESTLWGHSLHNCALCDGDVYIPQNGSKKSVVVIGGGDAAVEAVLLLHNLGVHQIHWIHRRQEYKASAINVEQVKQLENVDVWNSFVVVEWITRETNREGREEDHHPSQLILEGVRIVGATSNGDVDLESTSTLTIPCDGAFLMIGSTPKTDWLEDSGIDIDPVSKLIRLHQSSSNGRDNYVQYSTATSIQGVFAAGEVVDDVYRQALTASSDGAKAAIDAQRYLHSSGMETSTSKHKAPTAKQVTKQEPKKVEQTIDGVDCNLSKADCIESVVSKHPVVVFSKSYCPYCRRALEAIRSFSSRYTEPLVIDLTELSNMPEIQFTLGEMTGRRTVPNVYVGGNSIGGGDETTALYRSGELEQLLLKAGAFQ